MTSGSVIQGYSSSPQLVEFCKKLYGEDALEFSRQQLRYNELIKNYEDHFPDSGDDLHFFSAPGRTEIGGNHTDHNCGRVLAAAVNLDSVAISCKTSDNIITVYSRGYATPFVVELEYLCPKEKEAGTTKALIRGIAAEFLSRGYKVGGFNTYISSDVLKGSGLSSSASIEVLLGDILNHLYNDGVIEPLTIAMIGQYAENTYFQKPCGLMDQIACAVGGFVTIDFKDPAKPVVQKIEFDFASYGYKLLVVDTKGDHSDLTEEYASIPVEMKSVAKALGGEVCRDHTMDELFNKLPELRKETGDRAILRAMHFHGDNLRVENQANALLNGDFKKFLSLVNESGNSSWKWLQNCFTTKNPMIQGIALALAVTENFIYAKGEGACRVHGGGFAGTIQVFLPNELQQDYVALMESVFGEGSVASLVVRSFGSMHIKL